MLKVSKEDNNLNQYRSIFAVAIPMILSAISIPMLGIVDTAILGHLDTPIYLAAINIGTTIFNILFWGFGFLRMSTTGLIAQSFGESNKEKINLQLSQALLVAVGIALLLIIFQVWIGEIALKLMSEGGQVANLASSYFEIRILSAPAALVIYVLSGYFLAIQQAKKVLIIMLVNQVGNMLLDYLFVVHYQLHIEGVAYGSVISEYLAVFIGMILVFKSDFNFKYILQHIAEIIKYSEIKDFFLLNRDIFIRTLCLMLVFAMMTKGSARLGELSLAANAVLLNFFYLMSYALDGFAHAVESLCGQAYGAKENLKLKQLLVKVFKISLLIAFGFSGVYLLLGNQIVSWLTSIQEVRNYASIYLPWLIIIPFIAMPSFVYDGLFVATTEAKIMRNSMVLATLFCYIPLWYGLRDYGNHGLWMAFLGFFIVRSLAVHFYYMGWIKNWEKQLETITKK